MSILNQLLSFDFWKKDPTSKSLAKGKGLVGVCNTFVEFIDQVLSKINVKVRVSKVEKLKLPSMYNNLNL